LLQIVEMVGGERRVMFASDYPHWDFDNPMMVLSSLPTALKRRFCVDNVVDCYGPRLLGSSRRNE
jgi:predicted TIM-barrel fold metal-dependent hydrolase